MPVRFKDFSNSIQLNDSSREIDLRNSISREYYGLYHYLKAYGLANGKNSDDFPGKSHEKVINMVESILDEKCEKDLTIKSILTIISTAKSNRVAADYKLERMINLSHVNHNKTAIERLELLLDFRV